MKRQRDRDLDDELQAFVDDLTARNVARGMSPEQARRTALVETGGVQQVRELTREVWFASSLETLGRDIRYGARLLLRSPGFACVVVLTLALGIGANVTMFSVLHTVLWQSLPYPHADRLVIIDADFGSAVNAGLAPGEVRDIRARSQLLEHVSSVVGVDAHVDFDGQMERVNAARSS